MNGINKAKHTPDNLEELINASSAVLQNSSSRALSDTDSLDKQIRAGRRPERSLSTELVDVTEVEYRQIRLERVVLAGLFPTRERNLADYSMSELAALAKTAGSQVLDSLVQFRDDIDAATYIGYGKTKELGELVERVGADTVIFNSELGPSQRRAIEDIVKVKVVDRTALILDIFAQHAKSREGKAQVELAQLEYLLPRLRGWGMSMSRQAGGRVAAGAGIGSRGPGETQLELDRRKIRTRMAKLRKHIAQMAPSRETKRKTRRQQLVPSVAIVGYTNAGKSSLINALSRGAELVQNELFATLDTKVRRMQTPTGRNYTLSDTVGFVRNLPHQLVAAFESTLEEAQHADLLLHVVDASHPDPTGQIQAVYEVLRGIEGTMDTRELIVFNKLDLADERQVLSLATKYPEAIFVSCATGENRDQLLEKIAEHLPHTEVEVDEVIPFSRGDLVNRMHREGVVEHVEHTAAGSRVIAKVPQMLADQVRLALADPRIES